MNRTDYQRQYRRTHPRQTERRNNRISHTGDHRFIGIDGEGWNIDGRHEYTMLVTSDPTLYLSPGRALRTLECLDFISRLPLRRNHFYVSYFFDYDVTMILRDLAVDDPDKCRELFNAGRRYVWWNGYGIKYHAHKSFTVKRWTDDNSSKAVTIHDVQGYFNCPFVTALRTFGVGDEESLIRMAEMKEHRSGFTAAEVDDILRYSQQECTYLVALVGCIRDLSMKAGLSPYPYEGPGGLASNALSMHYGKTKHVAALDNMPDFFPELMLRVMYGGRFETLAVGQVDIPVDEWDLSSAYPWAMTQLPCLIHGHWSRTRKHHSQWSVSHLQFMNLADDYGVANPLPLRTATGALSYPSTGSGWYWRHEYEHDFDGWDYTIDHTYSWIPDGCDCHPFKWVTDLYDQRKKMEADHKGSGIALKLSLNTLYGKTAQRKPVPGAWLNLTYASMITSLVRRRIYDAYLAAGRLNTIMFATDAIFTINGTKIDTGIGLGTYEHAHEYPSIVIIQPGVYYSQEAAHFKTRGVPKKVIRQHGERICDAAILGIPYTVEIVNFHGLRISLARNDFDNLGQWTTDVRTIDTRPQTKRTGEWINNGVTWTLPTPNLQGESLPLVDDSIAERTRDLRDMFSDDLPHNYEEGE